MLSLQQQLDRGALVCPRTRSRLRQQGAALVAEDGTTYALTSAGVPILLLDAAEAEKYSRESAVMSRQYTTEAVQQKSSLKERLKAFLFKDYRTKASRDAFDKAISSTAEDALCLSIGGGQTAKVLN